MLLLRQMFRIQKQKIGVFVVCALILSTIVAPLILNSYAGAAAAPELPVNSLCPGGNPKVNPTEKNYTCPNNGGQVVNGKYTPPTPGTTNTTTPAGTCATDATGTSSTAQNPTDTTTTAATTGTDGASSCNDTDPELDCFSWDSALIGWITCPVFHALKSSADALDHYVNNMLQLPSQQIFDTSTSTHKGSASADGYYTAWKAFRTLAYAVLVVGGLVMVGAQAAGLEILDAYTVRKVLPRVLIVVIGISLSWPILKFLVQLTNDVGTATRAIIYGPFKGINHGVITIGGGATFFSGLAVGGFLADVLLLKFAGVGSLLATALMALFVGFMVLVLRQIVVTLLLVMAPLAIACYILPNTQKVYSFWWESFSKAMIMFPIITGMIAAGRVFAVVASQASTTGGAPGLAAVYQLTAIVAYIAPYFALPLTVRFAGGFLSTVGGMVNDRSRGAFDRLKKFRQNRRAESLHKAKESELLKGGKDDNRRGRFNKRVGQLANIGAAGPIYNKRSYQEGKERVEQQRKSLHIPAAQELAKSNAAFAQIMGDRALLTAAQMMVQGKTDTEIREYLNTQGGPNYAGKTEAINQGMAAARNVTRQAGHETVATAIQLALPTTSDAYLDYAKDAKGEYITDEHGNRVNRGVTKMEEDIAHLSEGDSVYGARILAMSRSNAERSGRGDLKVGGFGYQVGRLQEAMAAVERGGFSETERAMRNAAAHTEKLRTSSAQEMLQLKPEALAQHYESMTNSVVTHQSTLESRQIEMRELIKNGANQETLRSKQNEIDHADRALQQQLAFTSNIHDQLSSVAPEVAARMANEVMSRPTSRLSKQTIMENIETRKNGTAPNESFLEVRREFGANRRKPGEEKRAAQTITNAANWMNEEEGTIRNS